MPNKYDKLAEEAAQLTDEHFKNRVSGLTRLTDDEIGKLIKDTGISNKDLASILQVVKKSTADNETTAHAIANMNKGLVVLVEIVKRFI